MTKPPMPANVAEPGSGTADGWKGSLKISASEWKNDPGITGCPADAAEELPIHLGLTDIDVAIRGQECAEEEAT